MQKNGAGLQTANTCFWDNSTDGNIKHLFTRLLSSLGLLLQTYFHDNFVSQTGSCAVRWENKSMYCIVTVFGLAIWTLQSTFPSVNFYSVSKCWLFACGYIMSFIKYILNNKWYIYMQGCKNLKSSHHKHSRKLKIDINVKIFTLKNVAQLKNKKGSWQYKAPVGSEQTNL